MDTLLLIAAGLFVFIGFIGCILPIIPGVTLSYIGIILLHFSSYAQFSSQFLIGWGIAVIVVQLLDYIIPIWGTKKFGGSKYGIWGSTIGMVLGLFLGPWGIILGPFVGAIVGEIMGGKASADAIKKLIVAGFLIYYYVEAVI